MSQSMDKNLRKSPSTSPFDEQILRRDSSLLDYAVGTQSPRTNLAEKGTQNFRLSVRQSLGVRLSAEHEKGLLSPICVLTQFSGGDVYVAESAVWCAHAGS